MDKSVFEFELNGEKVGLRFGTLSFKYLQQQTKETISESLTRLSSGKLDLDFICEFFLAAARDYVFTNKKEAKLSVDDMGLWIDHVGGIYKAMEIIGNGVEQYFPKNSNSPAETGEKTTA